MLCISMGYVMDVTLGGITLHCCWKFMCLYWVKEWSLSDRIWLCIMIFSFSERTKLFLTSFKLFCPPILLCGSLTLPFPISYVALFSLRSLKCHEIVWFFVHTLEQRQTFPMLISSWTTEGAWHLALHVTAFWCWFHWRSSTTITVSWKFHYSVSVLLAFWYAHLLHGAESFLRS